MAPAGNVVCVILTLAGEPRAALELPVAGVARTSTVHVNPTAAATRGIRMAIKKLREASPLWVWLAVALLACGTLAYVAVVSILEYLMAGGA